MSPSRLLALVAVGALTATTSATGAVVRASGSSVPGQVAWVRDLLDDVSAVEAGSDAAIALTADGLVAVDGLTGEVRWTRPAAPEGTLDVLASPDGLTALVVEMAAGRWEVIGIDTTDGSERFRVDYPAIHQFFPTEPLIYPGLQLSVSNDAFAYLRDATQVVVNSLDTGDELSVVDMPAECSVAASWWGPAQSTDHGVIVPCFDPTAREVRGGYVFLETSTRDFTWREIRPGLVGDPLASPRLAPDGDLALLRFWRLTQGGGGAAEDAIVDVVTGTALAEAPRLLGQLGRHHTWLESGQLSASDAAVLVDLDSGAEVTLMRPCPTAKPVLVLPAGVLWFAFERVIGSSEPPCGLVFTAVTGAVTSIAVDAKFERPPSVVAVGETFVLHAFGADLLGLR